MTDRTTGAVWYLCFDPTNGNRLALVDTLPRSRLLTVRTFAPYDGPYVGDFGLRMGVDQVNGSTHVVFDTNARWDASAGPFGFASDGTRQIYAQLGATSIDNPNGWDHLAYTLEMFRGAFLFRDSDLGGDDVLAP